MVSVGSNKVMLVQYIGSSGPMLWIKKNNIYLGELEKTYMIIFNLDDGTQTGRYNMDQYKFKVVLDSNTSSMLKLLNE